MRTLLSTSFTFKNWNTSLSAVAPPVVIPVNSARLVPSATNPKSPNDELEFVRSHCPPPPAKIPI